MGKSVKVLVSQVRTARYILVIVLSFLSTWLPVIFFVSYEVLMQLTNKDPVLEDTAVNTTIIHQCLAQSLQNQNCNLEVDFDRNQAAAGVRKMFHLEQVMIIEFLLANFWSHFHSFLNPFLYPDFRNYVAQIPDWFKKEKEDKNEKEEAAFK